MPPFNSSYTLNLALFSSPAFWFCHYQHTQHGILIFLVLGLFKSCFPLANQIFQNTNAVILFSKHKYLHSFQLLPGSSQIWFRRIFTILSSPILFLSYSYHDFQWYPFPAFLLPTHLPLHRARGVFWNTMVFITRPFPVLACFLQLHVTSFFLGGTTCSYPLPLPLSFPWPGSPTFTPPT